MLNFPLWWWLAPCGAVSALAFAFLLYRQMLAAAPGDDQMQKVAGFVREGAFAHLKRQYRVVAIVFLGLVLLLMWQAASSLAGVAIGWFSEYYTSAEYGPTRWIADQCRTGAGTTVNEEAMEGLVSTLNKVGETAEANR